MKFLPSLLLIIGMAMFPTKAGATPVDDLLKEYMADGCLTLEEIQVIDKMPPNENIGMRPMSLSEIGKFNAIIGKDATDGGKIDIWVAFYKEPVVRIFGIKKETGCFSGGGFVNESAAKTFLERGV